MMDDIDLFGLAAGPMLTEKQRRRLRKSPQARGYAAIPGTGPAGETCKTCQHLYRKRMSGTFLKCALMERFWTNGGGTDIKARSPACRRWERRSETPHTD